jgi:hypothetical protein
MTKKILPLVMYEFRLIKQSGNTPNIKEKWQNLFPEDTYMNNFMAEYSLIITNQCNNFPHSDDSEAAFLETLSAFKGCLQTFMVLKVYYRYFLTMNQWWRIWGFHSGGFEELLLLGYDAV